MPAGPRLSPLPARAHSGKAAAHITSICTKTPAITREMQERALPVAPSTAKLVRAESHANHGPEEEHLDSQSSLTWRAWASALMTPADLLYEQQKQAYAG